MFKQASSLNHSLYRYRSKDLDIKSTLRKWRDNFLNQPKWLFALLLFSFLLNLWGIYWGLPDYRGWAADEITPSYVLHAIETQFSHGWYEIYPPLHFYILALSSLPLALLDLLHVVDFHSYLSYTILFFFSRFISVLMASGIIYMIYRIGLELLSRKAALITALFMALNPAFVYFSKMANMDVPYVFWFSISLYYYIRIFKYHHQLTDYLKFAVMAAFAVCTKDQAYALYVLMPVPVLVSLYYEKNRPRPFLKTIMDKRIGWTLVTGLGVFFLIYNVLFNISGFLGHFKQITSPGIELFREYPNTITGHFHMLSKAVLHLRFSMGWPFFLLSCTGLLAAFIRIKRHPVLAGLSLIAVSYYVFLFIPIHYHYVRFFLPLCLIFGFYGGFAFDVMMRTRIKPVFIYLLVMAGAIYSFLTAVSVDIAMTADSRITAEKWLKSNVKSDDSVAMVGWRQYLPRKGDIRGQYIANATVEILRELAPEYIVINDRICKCSAVYTVLTDGTLGYEPVRQFHNTPWPTAWLTHQIIKDGREQVSTNLDKINPPIVIFQKTDHFTN